MTEPEDSNAPAPVPVPTSTSSFWASIQWRLGLGLFVTSLTGGFFFVMSLFNARHPLDIPCCTIGSTVGIAGLWVVSRILWAWVEWPSANRFVKGVKAVIRFVLFDEAAERRRTPGPPAD